MDNLQEEILEALFTNEEAGKDSRIGMIVGAEDQKTSSADFMNMASDGLVDISESTVSLTEKGLLNALRIVRRHRLAECLMGYVLQIPPETMEKVACQMEHTLMPEVEESICTLLGHPDTAPDGKPVPPGKCCASKSRKIEKTLICIAELEIGETGKIAYIRPKSHSRLQRLTAFGIVPGEKVKLLQKSPAVCIRFEETEIAIENDIANEIYVWKI